MCNDDPFFAFGPEFRSESKEVCMLEWILILVIVAAVAGLVGFPKVAGAAWTGASILAVIVLVGIAILLIFGVLAFA